MASWKEKVSSWLPDSIAFIIDNIRLPWYNLNIYGGVNMSNKMVAIDKRENDIGVNTIAGAANNICAEICSSMRNGNDTIVKIISNTEISDERCENALDEYDKKQERTQKIIYIVIGATTFVVFSAIICNCIVKCSSK